MKELFLFKSADNNKLYKLLCIILAALLCISIASLINSPSIGLERSAQADFSSSAWLDQLMLKNTDLYGMDFIQNAGFSIQPSGGKIVVLYASKKPVADVRDYYIKNRHAIEKGRNDETALNLEMDTAAGRVKLVNYYSGVCQVYEMTLYLNSSLSQQYADHLRESLPEQSMRNALRDTALAGGKQYGAYVRYLYDDMDEYYKKGEPIFGCAFQFREDAITYEKELQTMKLKCLKTSYDKDQKTTYFQSKECVIGISLQDSASSGEFISVSMQKSK